MNPRICRLIRAGRPSTSSVRGIGCGVRYRSTPSEKECSDETSPSCSRTHRNRRRDRDRLVARADIGRSSGAVARHHEPASRALPSGRRQAHRRSLCPRIRPERRRSAVQVLRQLGQPQRWQLQRPGLSARPPDRLRGWRRRPVRDQVGPRRRARLECPRRADRRAVPCALPDAARRGLLPARCQRLQHRGGHSLRRHLAEEHRRTEVGGHARRPRQSDGRPEARQAQRGAGPHPHRGLYRSRPAAALHHHVDRVLVRVGDGREPDRRPVPGVLRRVSGHDAPGARGRVHV